MSVFSSVKPSSDHIIVTVVQARTGSSRLPGKVLLPIVGKPLLLLQLERMAASRVAGRVVVATTYRPEDNGIVALCEENGIDVFRGDETDLLDRHFQTGLAFGADAVVKIPSDCPIISAEVIDRVLGFYLENIGTYDYVSNLHPPSYPDGNDVEVIPMNILECAWQRAEKLYEREHTTPYIWDNPEMFRIGNILWEKGLDYSQSHRWTLDYHEDYEFFRSVFEELYPQNPLFSMQHILELLERRPDIAAINAKYAGVNWYRHHTEDLRTIH